MNHSRLAARTLELLQDRPARVSLDAIVAATDIKKDWLWAFMRGKFASPGVDKIERLYEFLAKEPLKLS